MKRTLIIIVFSTWEQTMSWGVMLLKLSSLSFGTENSLHNYKME